MAQRDWAMSDTGRPALLGVQAQCAINRFTPQDVEAEKTVEALAHREGMKEYESSSASSTLRGFVISTCEELERFLGYEQWDWLRDFKTDIKKWPRMPPLEYTKPRTAIEARLQAGLRRCWKKEHDAGVPGPDLPLSA
eukprot:jgi/Tetstr1/436350/TSEL_025186.t1